MPSCWRLAPPVYAEVASSYERHEFVMRTGWATLVSVESRRTVNSPKPSPIVAWRTIATADRDAGVRMGRDPQSLNPNDQQSCADQLMDWAQGLSRCWRGNWEGR
jgi:hypothetical protein